MLSFNSEVLCLIPRRAFSSATNTKSSPDGKFIITASNDNTARIYPRVMFAPFDELMELARKLSPRELTPQERERYLREPQNKQETPK